ncbi:MAG TPA: hypothetical protein VF546_16540 [Pyrinomonadaceae bacterium]|jgi:hypothetical protein
MIELRALRPLFKPRLVCLLLAALLCALTTGGCSRLIKNRVSVAPFVPPKVEAETAQLIAEVNRVAQVRSLRGKVDIQFLDNSFSKCGIIEKYRTSEGTLILQRPGQVYLSVNAPFGIKVAEMASDGAHFQVAVFQGDEKFRRFVRGTNNATYKRLAGGDPAEVDCEGGGQKKTAAMQQRAVGALSGLRPQHLTGALLVAPIDGEQAGLVYARSEAFNEVPDDRPNAKKGARVVRSFYTLDELAPETPGRARLLRRFWFDRSEQLRLARMQTFDERGQLITDVVYGNARPFGEASVYALPADIELTRPQEHYAIRISYQAPEEAKVDQPFEAATFVLENKSNLTELDLDKRE